MLQVPTASRASRKKCEIVWMWCLCILVPIVSQKICRLCAAGCSDGLCPECRKPSEFIAKEATKRKHEKLKKVLPTTRVVQKNLVYVSGLPPSLSDEKLLATEDYFGQYGKIVKIAINRRIVTNTEGLSCLAGVYVTFSSREEAKRAIDAVDSTFMDDRPVRAAYGTNKYCSYYLRDQACHNPTCQFLHELVDDSPDTPEANRKAAAQSEAASPASAQDTHLSTEEVRYYQDSDCHGTSDNYQVDRSTMNCSTLFDPFRPNLFGTADHLHYVFKDHMFESRFWMGSMIKSTVCSPLERSSLVSSPTHDLPDIANPSFDFLDEPFDVYGGQEDVYESSQPSMAGGFSPSIERTLSIERTFSQSSFFGNSTEFHDTRSLHSFMSGPSRSVGFQDPAIVSKGSLVHEPITLVQALPRSTSDLTAINREEEEEIKVVSAAPEGKKKTENPTKQPSTPVPTPTLPEKQPVTKTPAKKKENKKKTKKGTETGNSQSPAIPSVKIEKKAVVIKEIEKQEAIQPEEKLLVEKTVTEPAFSQGISVLRHVPSIGTLNENSFGILTEAAPSEDESPVTESSIGNQESEDPVPEEKQEPREKSSPPAPTEKPSGKRKKKKKKAQTQALSPMMMIPNPPVAPSINEIDDAPEDANLDEEPIFINPKTTNDREFDAKQFIISQFEARDLQTIFGSIDHDFVRTALRNMPMAWYEDFCEAVHDADTEHVKGILNSLFEKIAEISSRQTKSKNQKSKTEKVLSKIRDSFIEKSREICFKNHKEMESEGDAQSLQSFQDTDSDTAAKLAEMDRMIEMAFTPDEESIKNSLMELGSEDASLARHVEMIHNLLDSNANGPNFEEFNALDFDSIPECDFFNLIDEKISKDELKHMALNGAARAKFNDSAIVPSAVDKSPSDSLMLNEKEVQEFVECVNTMIGASSTMDHLMQEFNLTNEQLKFLENIDLDNLDSGHVKALLETFGNDDGYAEDEDEEHGFMSSIQDLFEQIATKDLWSEEEAKHIASRIVAITAEEIEQTMDIKLLEMELTKAREEEATLAKQLNAIIERNKKWEQEVYGMLDLSYPPAESVMTMV